MGNLRRFLIIFMAMLMIGLSYSCSIGKDSQALKAEIDKYPEVSFNDLNKLVNEGTVFLIDANERETYNDGHILGAVNFLAESSEFDQDLPQEKDKLVVCYCGSEKCLAWLDAAKELNSLGYTNVMHYKGGIKGWKKSGGEIEKG